MFENKRGPGFLRSFGFGRNNSKVGRSRNFSLVQKSLTAEASKSAQYDVYLISLHIISYFQFRESLYLVDLRFPNFGNGQVYCDFGNADFVSLGSASARPTISRQMSLRSENYQCVIWTKRPEKTFGM